MPRFFCHQSLAIGQVISLPDAVARHVQVLRLNTGDALTLFNGEGGEYAATLAAMDKRGATAEINAFSPREAELDYAITLAQALPEAAKMDWIIEKAVELGAAGVQPLAAQRCVVRLAAERAQKKMQHWQGVAISAAEQCGRNRIPQIADIADFRPWIGKHDATCRILLTPRAEMSLADWARSQPPQALTLIIGPEGGLSTAEEEAALQYDALALSMGPRVLRTETAGMTALAALNALWRGM